MNTYISMLRGINVSGQKRILMKDLLALYDSPNPRAYTEVVTKIQRPTLLLTAENGIVTAETAENAARLWKSTQPFRWVRIEGAGHNIRREQFEKFYAALTDFLREVVTIQSREP